MCANTCLCSTLCFLINLVIVSSAKVSFTNKGTVNLTTLQLVQIIARHGDRAPILPYPTDFYRNASVYSINGWGELSEIGAKQVYELGAYLRKRYNGFLPRKYRKRDFLMLSSDIDRAIMSAEANLAGLYELGPLPRSRDIFKEWQPVPIHTIPQEEDNLINGKAHCPRYRSLYKQFFQTDEFKNFLDENKVFVEFVANKSGLTTITTDFEEIFGVQDALRCQRLHNLTLPSWVNNTVYEKLEYFKAQSFVWNTRTEEMKRLKIGPLFQRLVEEMRAKVELVNLNLHDNDNNGTKEEDEIRPYQDPIAYRKMYVYSGHDSTISAILDSLNLFQPLHVPPYASALIVELHKTPGTADFFVELFYKNDTTRNPYRLDPTTVCNTISTGCSFEDLASFVEKFIPADWRTECQLQTSSSTRSVLHASPYGSRKLSVMKSAPAGVLDLERHLGDEMDDEHFMISLHPKNTAVPGLSGFAWAVISAMSILVSVTLLLVILRHKPCITRLPFRPVYQHYQQLG